MSKKKGNLFKNQDFIYSIYYVAILLFLLCLLLFVFIYLIKVKPFFNPELSPSSNYDPKRSEENIVKEAYFRFKVVPYSDTVVFKLDDKEKITEAREILSGKSDKIMTSKIIPEKAGYNSPWSFHINSSSVIFSEFTPEVCDLNIRFTEDKVVAYLNGEVKDLYDVWCPWGFMLIEEVNMDFKCPDGTLYGSCSFNRPMYCTNGILKARCDLCPCPVNKDLKCDKNTFKCVSMF
ncbi:MAG: hypothetical protein QXI33_02765 [Candidatus Pacearchaeota archaeon]